MFTSPRFPTGLSVEQAKKDAKQLAKDNHYTLSEGQNYLAFLHGRSSWATLIKRIKAPLSLVPKQKPFDNVKYNRSFLAIMGNSGSGKTTLMLNSALHLLNSGERVVMISPIEYQAVNSGDIDSGDGHPLLKSIVKTHPDKFSLIDPEKTVFADIMLNGAVLLISDDVMLNNSKSPEFERLIKTSMHTLFLISRLSDLKLSTGNLLDDVRVYKQIIVTPGSDPSEGVWWIDGNMLKQFCSMLPFRKEEPTLTLLLTPSSASVLEFHSPDGDQVSIPFVADIMKN